MLIDVNEAATRLDALITAAARGDEVIITRADAPIAHLLPADAPPSRRRVAPPGAMAGQIWIADDFDEPLDDLADA